MRRNEQFLVALMIAVSLLLSSMPIVAAGANADSHPAFTLDICTPAQVTSHSSLQAGAPLPPSQEYRFHTLCTVVEAIVFPLAARFADAPMVPPPESPVV